MKYRNIFFQLSERNPFKDFLTDNRFEILENNTQRLTKSVQLVMVNCLVVFIQRIYNTEIRVKRMRYCPC